MNIKRVRTKLFWFALLVFQELYFIVSQVFSFLPLQASMPLWATRAKAMPAKPMLPPKTSKIQKISAILNVFRISLL